MEGEEIGQMGRNPGARWEWRGKASEEASASERRERERAAKAAGTREGLREEGKGGGGREGEGGTGGAQLWERVAGDRQSGVRGGHGWASRGDRASPTLRLLCLLLCRPFLIRLSFTLPSFLPCCVRNHHLIPCHSWIIVVRFQLHG